MAGAGRCERCGAWAPTRVDHKGWLIHPECIPKDIAVPDGRKEEK